MLACIYNICWCSEQSPAITLPQPLPELAHAITDATLLQSDAEPKDASRDHRIEQFFNPLMEEFQECETYIEVGMGCNMLARLLAFATLLPCLLAFCSLRNTLQCSAKTLKSVSEVFRYAQKAVLYPIAPLYLAK